MYGFLPFFIKRKRTQFVHYMKKASSSVDLWWRKLVPRDSLRPKILSYLSETGPSSVYDISKSLYNVPTTGYPTVFHNLKELERESILQRVRNEPSSKGGRKKLYAITEYIGVPGTWAYVGPSLDFSKLLQSHRSVFKQTKGLDAYHVMWDTLTPQFCVEIARKSFLSMIEGLNDKTAIFNMLVSYILDEKEITPNSKFVRIARKNDLILDALRDSRNDLTRIIEVVERWK